METALANSTPEPPHGRSVYIPCLDTSGASVIALVCLCALVTTACAQTLTERIDALVKAPAFAHGLQGVMVKSLRTGQRSTSTMRTI